LALRDRVEAGRWPPPEREKPQLAEDEKPRFRQDVNAVPRDGADPESLLVRPAVSEQPSALGNLAIARSRTGDLYHGAIREISVQQMD
jgi:hypothetical protein